MQGIAKRKHSGRGTTDLANALTATDKQVPNDLAAENKSFPAVRKSEGLRLTKV